MASQTSCELIQVPPSARLASIVSHLTGYREGGQGAGMQWLESAPLTVPLVINFGSPFGIGLGNALGRDGPALRERLGPIPDWPRRFALVDAFIARRLGPTPSEPVAHAYRLLARELADEPIPQRAAPPVSLHEGNLWYFGTYWPQA
ncbi:MAG: hypothetical protein ACN6O8_13240 [Achromobacter sp.]|uniref:hypothetical protein n=1 Tax=Achromobacter sp. TaxID=134375 RepID=UPI003D007D26